MKRTTKNALTLWLVWMIGACAALGVPTPQTFNERAAAGYTAVTTAVDDTRILLLAKKLTPDDAANVIKQTDNIVAGLDIARTLNKSDPLAAQTKLTATLAALSAVQAYLAAKKGTQ